MIGWWHFPEIVDEKEHDALKAQIAQSKAELGKVTLSLIVDILMLQIYRRNVATMNLKKIVRWSPRIYARRFFFPVRDCVCGLQRLAAEVKRKEKAVVDKHEMVTRAQKELVEVQNHLSEEEKKIDFRE